MHHLYPLILSRQVWYPPPQPSLCGIHQPERFSLSLLCLISSRWSNYSVSNRVRITLVSELVTINKPLFSLFPFELSIILLRYLATRNPMQTREAVVVAAHTVNVGCVLLIPTVRSLEPFPLTGT